MFCHRRLQSWFIRVCVYSRNWSADSLFETGTTTKHFSVFYGPIPALPPSEQMRRLQTRPKTFFILVYPPPLRCTLLLQISYAYARFVKSCSSAAETTVCCSAFHNSCNFVCMYVCLMSWGSTGGQQTDFCSVHASSVSQNFNPKRKLS